MLPKLVDSTASEGQTLTAHRFYSTLMVEIGF